MHQPFRSSRPSRVCHPNLGHELDVHSVHSTVTCTHVQSSSPPLPSSNSISSARDRRVLQIVEGNESDLSEAGVILIGVDLTWPPAYLLLFQILQPFRFVSLPPEGNNSFSPIAHWTTSKTATERVVVILSSTITGGLGRGGGLITVACKNDMSFGALSRRNKPPQQLDVEAVG